MPTDWPPTVVKTYQSKTLPEATALLQADTHKAWSDGYVVASQTWAPGGRTGAGIICLILGVLLLLAPVPLAASGSLVPVLILLFVALFFIYAGVVSRSPGTLSVTFSRRVEERPASLAPAPVQVSEARQPGIADQLRSLASLRDSGLITTEEHDAKKAQLLDRM